MNELERFEESYIPVPESGCWLWLMAVGKDGYGRFWFEHETITPHRASFLLSNGEIPEDLCVRHSCDVRSCVNPDHLSLGTHMDNSADNVDRGRQTRHLGEKNGGSRITELQAIEIINSNKSVNEISQAYGLSSSSIYRLKNKTSWKYLHDKLQKNEAAHTL